MEVAFFYGILIILLVMGYIAKRNSEIKAPSSSPKTKAPFLPLLGLPYIIHKSSERFDDNNLWDDLSQNTFSDSPRSPSWDDNLDDDFEDDAISSCAFYAPTCPYYRDPTFCDDWTKTPSISSFCDDWSSTGSDSTLWDDDWESKSSISSFCDDWASTGSDPFFCDDWTSRSWDD
ncbi:MAG: hypothetical protein ABWJ99_07735 [Caldimicrobium sp.]